MARFRFPLERGGPRVVEIRWRRGLRDAEVAFAGAALARVEAPALREGARVALPDGSTLFVRLTQRRWWSIAMRDALTAERNGVPLPGSDGEPRTIARNAASLILLFGLLMLGLGALMEVSATVQRGAFGPTPVLAAGALVVACGVCAALGSRGAVLAAAVVLAVDAVAALALGGAIAPVAILIRVAVVVHLVDAWRRMEPRATEAPVAT